MENELEQTANAPSEPNKLEALAKNAIEEREAIEHNQVDISQLIIREGTNFSNSQTGNIAFKDNQNTVVQIGKNIGLRYDTTMFNNHEINDRVTVYLENDEHRVMAAVDFENQQQQQGQQDRAVELDNEM